MGERVALVTGASRGIGAATARALAARGHHVILTARDVASLEAVEDAIHTSGGTATIAPLDLLDGDSIGRLAGAVAARWSALDLLVLNAATLGTLSSVAHVDLKEFARTVALNLTAQGALIAAFDALLRASTAPRVIGVTSSVARTPRAYWGAYAASKAGFEALLRAYDQENRNVGRVAVALVDPGATRTAMRARAFPGEDPQDVKSPDVVAARIAELAEAAISADYYERVNDE